MKLMILPTQIMLPDVEAPVLAFANVHPLTSLPVTSLACWYCEHNVVADDDVPYVSRVDGDSRYGYQPIHAACNDRFAEDMERDAENTELLREAEEFWADVCV